MSVVGADASFTRQSGASLAKAGIRSIGRYAGPADSGKVITLAELKDHLSHGVSVWLVYEVDVNSWRGGYGTGHQHGTQTRTWARSTLWWPDDRPIYAAYDTNVSAADKALFVSYQQGFNDGQGVSAGAAYGDGYVLRTLRDAGLIRYTWLSDSSAFTESRDFAAHGNPSIIQYYGKVIPGLSGIDVDECFGDDWGQHPGPVAPVPQPALTSEVTLFLFQEKGSTAVNVAGVTAKGWSHVDNPARLNEWKAILVGMNPANPMADHIWQVEPGFAQSITNG